MFSHIDEQDELRENADEDDILIGRPICRSVCAVVQALWQDSVFEGCVQPLTAPDDSGAGWGALTLFSTDAAAPNVNEDAEDEEREGDVEDGNDTEVCSG